MLNLGDVGFSLVAPNSGLIRFNKNLNETARAFDRANASGSRFGSLLAGGALGAGLYAGIKSTLTLADNYQVLSRRIATASDSAEDFSQNMDSLVATSMQTGTALNTNVKLFQDLKRAGLGTSSEIQTVSKAVSQLGVLSGATTEDMKYGLRQLSQGLSAGVFRAEEFNSVQENTPEIMKQIRIGLGKTQGQLRQMVLDGKLLSEDVFKVLVERADEVAAAFAKIPPDMARGIESAKTGLTVFFGQLDKGLQLTRTLAQAAFDFGNFIASDDALNKALMGIATFKVYFKNFVMEPAREAFDFIRLGFTELANASGNGFSGFLTAARNIDTARDAMSGMGLAATLLAASLIGKLIPSVVSLGFAFVKTAAFATSLFAPGIMLAVKALMLLKPAALGASIAVLRFGATLLLNPVGIFVAGLTAMVTALGYFAGKNTETGNRLTDTWVGIQAILVTLRDRFTRVFGQMAKDIASFATDAVKSLTSWLDLNTITAKIKAWADIIIKGIAGIVTVAVGYFSTIDDKVELLALKAKRAFTFDIEKLKLVDSEIAALAESVADLGSASNNFQRGWESAGLDETFKVLTEGVVGFGNEVADIVSNLRFDPSVLGLDHFWAEVTENSKRIGKKYGNEAGESWIDELINGIKDKFGSLSPEVMAEFDKLKANIAESPMQITPEDLLPTGFTEAGEKKASEFMQGYNNAFESFSQSTSQMLTDALFGDSSVSFKEIARKLVKDLLTNTLQFLIISPITKDIQKFMGSLFKAPDGSNPFDALAGAANGIPGTKKENGVAAGGFSKILGGIGGAMKIFGGNTASVIGAAGSFTSSFLSPDAGGFMSSQFSDGAQASNSSSINNIFNISAKDPASFQMARGRIANDITRSSRNA